VPPQPATIDPRIDGSEILRMTISREPISSTRRWCVSPSKVEWQRPPSLALALTVTNVQRQRTAARKWTMSSKPTLAMERCARIRG
jgi:hypothetical protein